MHLKSAGPYWWGEEVKAGMELCCKMLQQPGFVVLAVYMGWAYAHFSLVLMVCLAIFLISMLTFHISSLNDIPHFIFEILTLYSSWEH